MITEIDYALMAGASYISTRSEINQFPVPEGWFEPIEKRTRDDSTGFEATHFIRGTEIVISFAGTYDNPLNPLTKSMGSDSIDFSRNQWGQTPLIFQPYNPCKAYQM